MTEPTQETSRARNILYRQLMNIPHRDLTPMVTAFNEAMVDDPDFMSRACVYLNSGGTKIRDQEEAAIISLLQATPTFPEYREAGRCLLLGGEVYDINLNGISGLPPFRIFKVAQHIRNSNVKVPRLMRGIMGDYLHFLEKDPMRFDGVVMLNRKAIKSAYKYYHVAPSPRSQSVLFDETPPPDSKLAILKQIAQETDAVERARLVIENRIPYTVAVSILPKMDATTGIALVEVMTPTQALNSRQWVERSGLLSIPEVRDAYLSKVKKATKSVASAEHRKSARGEDAQVEQAIHEAKEKAVDKDTRIQQDTLLLIDRSSSMGQALLVAQELGARIAPLCDGELMAVTFNDYAQEVQVDGDSLSDWQHAFRGIRCGGWTSMQAGFDHAIRGGFMPQQIVFITDGGENRGSFVRSFQQFVDQQGYEPHIVIIRITGTDWDTHGNTDRFTSSIERAGFRVDKFETSGEDYFIYDQVVSILGGPAAQSIVEKILSTPLPHRI